MVLTSTETIRLIWDGAEKWAEGSLEVGEEVDYIPICHHHSVFYIKMGSDESHFNVSLIVRHKITIQCPCIDHDFWRERRAETDSNRGPSAYQPSALPLGQTGSRMQWPWPRCLLTGRCHCQMACKSCLLSHTTTTKVSATASWACSIQYPLQTGYNLTHDTQSLHNESGRVTEK